jgi:hypothetical protein
MEGLTPAGGRCKKETDIQLYGGINCRSPNDGDFVEDQAWRRGLLHRGWGVYGGRSVVIGTVVGPLAILDAWEVAGLRGWPLR